MPTLNLLDTIISTNASEIGTPVLIDTDVSVTDAEQDWNGGTLVVSGLLAGDIVAIQATADISIVGGALFWQGSGIATITGGVGGDLIIAFNDPLANSDAVITAILRALEFSMTGTPVFQRSLAYTLTDAASNTTSESIIITVSGDSFANVIKGTAANESLYGDDGNDTLKGEGGEDALYGDAGDDNLVGGLGDDYLSGGVDNDTLNGGAGADTMEGGDGNDTYYVDDIGDTVTEWLSQGTDTVRSTLTTYTLAYSVENLILMGAAAEGHGNANANTLTGTALDNDLYGANGNDVINALGGADMLSGGDGADTLDGGNGNDELYGDADNDTLKGGAGDDIIDGGTGADAMDGGTGNDTYFVDDLGDTVAETAANGGQDSVFSGVSFTLSANIEHLLLLGTGDLDATGNSLANRLEGTSGANTLSGAGGNDILYGYDGIDRLEGGAGADLLDGGDGDDVMLGGIGDDTYIVDQSGDVVTEASGEGYDKVHSRVDYTLAAGSAVEELHSFSLSDLVLGGNALNNRIFGWSGDDTLYGYDGDDRLDGGAGDDEMSGGDGNDTYFIDSQNDVIIENAGEGVDTVWVTLGNFYVGENVEIIHGLNNAGQRLGGNAQNNVIYGADGNDILAGGGGDDDLRGGLGNDSLNGNAGDDTLRGGDGDDTYYVDGYDIIVEAAGQGTDTVRTWVNWTLDANVENLVMMGTDDLGADGNELNNVMTGNSGWNDLYGADGDDTLYGMAGDDLLMGDDGSDTLYGGSGEDTLIGGLGADHMFGGTGDDAYVVDDIGDTTTDQAGGGFDLVYASATHTLGAFIEFLYMRADAGDIDGTGNAIDNLMAGSDGDNVLSGLGGDDTIGGAWGADTLYGGDGNDFLDDGFDLDIDYLYGGGGKDQLVGSVGDFLYGGADNDEYSITQDGINVIELDGEGYDTVYAQVSYTLTDHVEKLVLLCFADDIDGTGNAQANTIQGNCQANVLNGMAGNDILEGNDGEDTLIGGLGNDRMSGGLDADIFRILNSDMIASHAGGTRQADIILDLDFSDGDRIDLSDIDADIYTDGNQDFHAVAKFSKHVAEALVIYNAVNDKTTVQLDVDGDGKADYHLTVYGDATAGQLLDGSSPTVIGGWLGFDMAV